MELAANYVVGVTPEQSAYQQLQVHDVIVALDGTLLNERSLAETMAPGASTLRLTVMRPGPPYVNPNLKEAVVRAEMAVMTRKERKAARAENKRSLHKKLSKRPSVQEVLKRGVLKSAPDGVPSKPPDPAGLPRQPAVPA